MLDVRKYLLIYDILLIYRFGTDYYYYYETTVWFYWQMISLSYWEELWKLQTSNTKDNHQKQTCFRTSNRTGKTIKPTAVDKTKT